MKNKSTWLAIGFCALASAVLLSCATPPKTPGTATDGRTAGGWSALWADRTGEAEKIFADALKADPGSSDAARGLGLALYARGAVFEAGEKLLSSIASQPGTEIAVAVRAFVAAQIPHRESLAGKIATVDRLLAGGKRSMDPS